MSERRSVERGRSEGWVYFISSGQGAIKIGWAKDPDKRLRQLQIGTPKPLRLVGVIAGSQMVERLIHKDLALARLRGEWFDRKKALPIVNHLIDTMGFRVIRAANSRTIPEGNRVGEFLLFVPNDLCEQGPTV